MDYMIKAGLQEMMTNRNNIMIAYRNNTPGEQVIVLIDAYNALDATRQARVIALTNYISLRKARLSAALIAQHKMLMEE